MASVDVEDENILSALFQDEFPDSWQHNPDFVKYLVDLSSCGVDRLAREPERLAEERAQILGETQDLAFQHYSTFIQTADCSRQIFSDFQIVEQHLAGLLEKLPGLSQECERVVRKAQDISSSRRMNTLTLQRHTQILEVLEMPQLMDTCVRNGYYEEALELAAHVKRLEKKHTSIPVIVSMVGEVKAASQLMLSQLLQQLRSNLQLPACLRIIGFLRRMDVFSEAELRIKFLQARDSWFQGIVDAIPKDDAYTHITKTIEASRVHLFDIITQYRAIFSDDDPMLVSGREEAVNESALFHGWVIQKVSQFLASLEADLRRGVGGRLDSLLGQCMYFGLSFARVGADFRTLLTPIFHRAALLYFQEALHLANLKFEENMQHYSLLSVSSVSSSYGAVAQMGALSPPAVLLDYFPLAAYCNHVLSAFNELRLCAPLSLAAQTSQALQSSLLQLTSTILAFHRTERTTFNAEEEERFTQFCATYVADLLPFLNRSLQALFPPTQLAAALGLPPHDMARLAAIALVDLKQVMAPLEHLACPPQPPSPVQTVAPSVRTVAPSVQTVAPSVQTAPPSVQTDIPSTSSAPPNMQTDTPNMQTDTPNMQTDTPNMQTDTSYGQPDTPSVQTDAPSVQTDTPSVQTDTPSIQTDTPKDQTDTSSVQTDTPSVQMDTPIQTDTSDVRTDTPNVQTDTPNVQTDIPSVQMDTPSVQTDTPST